jgi:hypothetical protein
VGLPSAVEPGLDFNGCRSTFEQFSHNSKLGEGGEFTPSWDLKSIGNCISDILNASACERPPES